MAPTLIGRIQNRIFVLGTIGVLWTLLIVPLLPVTRNPSASTLSVLGAKYLVGYSVLLIVIVVGCVVWDPIYQGLQQFRWEKDWPTLFILLQGIPEGILAWFVLQWIGPEPSAAAPGGVFFVIQFSTTWIVAFLWMHGPMRVLFPRQRFRGGRVLPRRGVV